MRTIREEFRTSDAFIVNEIPILQFLPFTDTTVDFVNPEHST